MLTRHIGGGFQVSVPLRGSSVTQTVVLWSSGRPVHCAGNSSHASLQRLTCLQGLSVSQASARPLQASELGQCPLIPDASSAQRQPSLWLRNHPDIRGFRARVNTPAHPSFYPKSKTGLDPPEALILLLKDLWSGLGSWRRKQKARPTLCSGSLHGVPPEQGGGDSWTQKWSLHVAPNCTHLPPSRAGL
jgi:hypothetical protein